MGNVYHITRCYYCKHVFEGGPANSLHCPGCGELIVGPHSVMVHRAENWERAEGMLESDMSITEVARRFCTDCGGYQDPDQPCTCMVDQAKAFEEKYPEPESPGKEARVADPNLRIKVLATLIQDYAARKGGAPGLDLPIQEAEAIYNRMMKEG